jgi:hypothetical protein
MPWDATPCAARGITVEDLDEEVCLYRSDIDEVLVLNRSAGDIWRIADGDLTLEEIVDRLAHAYHQSSDDMRGDIARVVQTLLDRGYLQSSGSVPAG